MVKSKTPYQNLADPKPFDARTVRFREVNQLPADVRGPANSSIYGPIIEALVNLKPGKVIEIDVPDSVVDFRINVYQALKTSRFTKGLKFHTRFNHTRDKLYVWRKEA